MSVIQSPLLLLIDGHSLAFRAYYAFAKAKKGPLQTTTGIPTSICFGFLNSLLQIIESQKPNYLAIAFDRKEATFRHQADSNYKANRQETPSDFIEDMIHLQELLDALNLKQVSIAGYEADDIIATLTNQGYQHGYQVKILSGDRDLFQLVDDQKGISVLYLEKKLGNYTEFNQQEVEKKLKVTPEQVVDYKALCGDPSDQISGVRGIGEKTAVKLLHEYQTLANIYSNIEKIKGTLKNKLTHGKKDAFHSQYLAQLVNNLVLDISLDHCKLEGFNPNNVIPKLEQLELNSFISKLNQLQQKLGGKVELNQEQILSKLKTTTEVEESRQLNQLPLLFDLKKSSRIQPRIIDTVPLLDELINHLNQKGNAKQFIAWDTETTSLNPREAKLVGIGCCWGNLPTDVAYVPLNHIQGKQLEFETVINALKPILENDHYPKAFHHTKFDRLVLLAQGIKLQGIIFDTMLASYVINSETSHKLSHLSQQYLSNIYAQDYDSLNISKDKTIADLDIETVTLYCGLDAYATFKLVPILGAKIAENLELEKVFTLETQLEPILAKMETLGVKIDQEYLKKLSEEIEQNLRKIEKEAYQNAGEEFNLSSPKQLSDLLFNKLGLDKRKSRKNQTGYSTNHAILEKLKEDHPVIKKILAYRTLAKLKSTYVDALPSLVDIKDQRIHTSYNQAITITGRLSSSNPNLQNIPIRTEFSRQIRKAFIPRDKWLFLAADYSQIELRILAHLSQEPILLEAYRQNQDIHTVTARLLWDKEDISSEERSLGKTINFGVIYGMGAQKFARETKVGIKEAQVFINKYHQRYAQIFNYLETVKKEAIANGYVKTILGRRRYFEFRNQELKRLRGSNPQEIDLQALKIDNYDAQLLRGAANAPIQGSSADIIKIAMVKIDEILSNYQAKLLLQVHDELVLEAPVEEIEELTIKIKQTMENAVKLTIPLLVDIHTGKNWMEAK
jgi:DNA polymerase-1